MICGDCFHWLQSLPQAGVDLLFLDPPYNLKKKLGGKTFARVSVEQYTDWLDDLLSRLKPLLSPTATIYLCSDWFSSQSVFAAASRHFVVRNRITWEREKGRGHNSNWKNASEDIWFCTVGDDFVFNVEDVKIRRRVLTPYVDADGSPKDWVETDKGIFRDTHPSNLWTDITIPFWAMPENTSHPAQKSEKLLAKLIMASSNAGDLVFDPFAGSGTACVVAKKLGRRFVGIESDMEFCLVAAKRLALASVDGRIQGFEDGVFWERNSGAELRKQRLDRHNSPR